MFVIDYFASYGWAEFWILWLMCSAYNAYIMSNYIKKIPYRFKYLFAGCMTVLGTLGSMFILFDEDIH